MLKVLLALVLKNTLKILQNEAAGINMVRIAPKFFWFTFLGLIVNGFA
jgi:hypothetical protein